MAVIEGLKSEKEAGVTHVGVLLDSALVQRKHLVHFVGLFTHSRITLSANLVHK